MKIKDLLPYINDEQRLEICREETLLFQGFKVSIFGEPIVDMDVIEIFTNYDLDLRIQI